MAKFNISEVGRMWREQSQLLYKHLDNSITGGSLAGWGKVIDPLGWSVSELWQKVSMTPRTPLSKGEVIALEHILHKADHENFSEYLNALHGTKGIHVEMIISNLEGIRGE